MVEATTEENTTTTASGSTNLNIAPVDQASALGLFRQEELTTHVDVVLASYITESQKIAQVSREFICHSGIFASLQSNPKHSVDSAGLLRKSYLCQYLLALLNYADDLICCYRKMRISNLKSSPRTWRQLDSTSLLRGQLLAVSIIICLCLACLEPRLKTHRTSHWDR